METSRTDLIDRLIRIESNANEALSQVGYIRHLPAAEHPDKIIEAIDRLAAGQVELSRTLRIVCGDSRPGTKPEHE